MATFAQYTPSHALVRPSTGLRRLLARLFAWRAERREIARTLRELERVDTRDLRDLGITRYDFEAIARGVFTR